MTCRRRSETSRRHRGEWLPAAVFVAIAVVVLLPSRSSAASGGPQIEVESRLVILPVSITDASGNFVSGLSSQNFRIDVDGASREVTVFRQEDSPVAVGLVVDRSRSMFSKLQGVATAASAFAHSSNPNDDMFIVDFGDDVVLEPLGGKAFSNSPDELERALSMVIARGQTALYDGVACALTHVQLSHWEKKALVVVSDGGDNASHHKYSQILDEARRSQAAIYSIALIGDSEEDENPGLLRRLSADTGGLSFFPKPGDSITDISTQIARDLRTQYTIGFSPQANERPGSFHAVHVRVSAPGLGKVRVRTRLGYFVPDNNAPHGRAR